MRGHLACRVWVVICQVVAVMLVAAPGPYGAHAQGTEPGLALAPQSRVNEPLTFNQPMGTAAS